MVMTNAGPPTWLATLLFFITASFLSPLTLAYTELSDDALRGIPSGGEEFDIKSGSLLAPILIPRVPGTPGSFKAQDHFVQFFKNNLPGWSIEWHNSTSKTPATGDKEIPFSNLIMRRDPPWAKIGDVSRLTLAAHYDSLYEPHGFIGALDSAAPCAMLLQMAKGVEQALVKKWKIMEESGDIGLTDDVGVQILFLDGEEAWVEWTATDSLYGSRSLAETWDTQVNPPLSTFKTPLSSISLFVLLDLLGAKDPRVPSFFPTTHWAYRNLAKIEYRMRKLHVLETKPRRPFLPDKDKQDFRMMGYVEDDHVPFMLRGVDILHLIPNPFPAVWHRMDDDGEHLDLPTVRDWTRIMTAFTAEWMELGAYMATKTKEEFKRELEVMSTHRTEL